MGLGGVAQAVEHCFEVKSPEYKPQSHQKNKTIKICTLHI
jgi:hypothetical protein